MSANLATSIIQTLRQRGFQAYLVGGCVRDLLLKREPADFDVATSATPPQVMEIFPETYAVGAQFGVVLVPLPESECDGSGKNTVSKPQAVEVATFRSDLGYADGRHPDEVRFSQDPRQDVVRRDFTINGMMLDPVSGDVLDFVGGREDLEAKLVRAIGDPDRRFGEDKLRMLRAVRFAARFEYEIEPQTFAAIQRHARNIQVVSRERVRDELTKMLTEGQSPRVPFTGRSRFAQRSASRGFCDERCSAASGVSSGGRCVYAHAVTAGKPAPPLPANAGMGRLASRRGKAGYFPRRS